MHTSTETNKLHLIFSRPY